jgi:hypothetical protein
LLENTHPGAVIADMAYDADALIDNSRVGSDSRHPTQGQSQVSARM